jgi:hypothetical protein
VIEFHIQIPRTPEKVFVFLFASSQRGFAADSGESLDVNWRLSAGCYEKESSNIVKNFKEESLGFDLSLRGIFSSYKLYYIHSHSS